jgi:hypothetical protein
MASSGTNPSAPERLAGLLLAAAFEPDPARGRQLAEEYATAFNDGCSEAWGQRIAASRALLDEAERALDRAETTTGDERCRLLALFETYMSAAKVHHCLE